MLFQTLENTLQRLQSEPIAIDRLAKLDPLIRFAKQSLIDHGSIKLHFICTHNSRRSQLAQAWAHACGLHFALPIQSFSGGAEVTAFHANTIVALQSQGFEISGSQSQNAHHMLKAGVEDQGILMFSKLIDDSINPTEQFAAVMTCDHADKNCPFVLGATQRISLPYQDPKIADGTPSQAAVYAERSFQIAHELVYVFHQIALNQ